MVAAPTSAAFSLVAIVVSTNDLYAGSFIPADLALLAGFASRFLKSLSGNLFRSVATSALLVASALATDVLSSSFLVCIKLLT